MGLLKDAKISEDERHPLTCLLGTTLREFLLMFLNTLDEKWNNPKERLPLHPCEIPTPNPPRWLEVTR